MPRTRIIRVQNMEDIDLSKVSVYDLNNRYVDAAGNMFGLRYDRAGKKIEVIKLIRTPAKSAGFFAKKVYEYKRGHLSSGDDGGIPEPTVEGGEEEYREETGEGPGDGGNGIEPDFEPDTFINTTLERMKSHRDRLNGIMMNIKNSNVVKESNREESTYLIDIFRNLDIDGVQRIDKILNDHKELVSYPRSLVYYVAKLDTRSKNIVDSLGGDTAKMRFIFLTEMYFAIRNVYRTLQKVLREFSEFLQGKNLDEIRSLSHNETKSFEDGRISVENTLSEAEDILAGCARLEKHMFRDKKL